jgi:predicted choloylglycine hydrolase
MSDCLWGLLDGINDAGLAVSLAFGGRRVAAGGFAVPLVVRYLLETCATTEQAGRALRRIPVQASYSLTIVDRGGAAVSAAIAPDRPPAFTAVPVATNHQGGVEWPEHATAFASVEREARLIELLDDPELDEPDLIDAFLAPPLRSTAYGAGFGTLYTAAYRPLAGAVEYRWPGVRWRQSFDAFEPGTRTIRLAAAPAADAA